MEDWIKKNKIAAGIIAALSVLLVFTSIGVGQYRYSGHASGSHAMFWVLDKKTGQAKRCWNGEKNCSAWMR